jgi:hypothetical protein
MTAVGAGGKLEKDDWPSEEATGLNRDVSGKDCVLEGIDAMMSSIMPVLMEKDLLVASLSALGHEDETGAGVMERVPVLVCEPEFVLDIGGRTSLEGSGREGERVEGAFEGEKG